MRGVRGVCRPAREEKGSASPGPLRPMGALCLPSRPLQSQIPPAPSPPGSEEGWEEPGLLPAPAPGQVELSPGEVSSHASAPPPSLEGSPDCRGKPPRASPLLTVSPLSVRSCEPFSIYAPWGERCEHLGMKLGAFFGILFGALGFLLLLGAAGFVVLRFWCYSGNHYSYPLDSES